LAAAKAFLEQHLQAGGGGADAAAAAAAMTAATAAAAARKPGGGGGGSSREAPLGQVPHGVPLLTTDDYFARSSEFTCWLQELRGQFFNGEVPAQGAAGVALARAGVLHARLVSTGLAPHCHTAPHVAPLPPTQHTHTHTHTHTACRADLAADACGV
jgi:hypothetical protein